VEKQNSSSTYNVRSAELLVRHFEHVLEIIPIHHIAFDEQGAWLAAFARRMLVNKLLRFFSQSEVGNQNIAVAAEEQLCKGEIDAFGLVSSRSTCLSASSTHEPDPAPVMMAVFPRTEKGTKSPAEAMVEGMNDRPTFLS